MMEKEKECEEIVYQMSAVKGALDHASAMIVSKHLEQCIHESKEDRHAEKLVEEAVNLLIKSR
ncbi:metal-sensing transcriptional repressor [Virgibacillus sp. MSJ-26]|uniref:metal-sensing transcriptional repressor n=1 Tax=Virgibacillus sp. MSJ-26 TaxID=2841522 RepID=UPI00209F26F3|nr:metal-sensing transcriptional repressor [Virgibacillus sp. MSJ-26]